jgi:hypothetical protein
VATQVLRNALSLDRRLPRLNNGFFEERQHVNLTDGRVLRRRLLSRAGASRFKRSAGAAASHVGWYVTSSVMGAHPSNVVLVLNINLSRSV